MRAICFAAAGVAEDSCLMTLICVDVLRWCCQGLVLDGLGLRHSDGVHEVLDGTLLCALGPVHASHLAALLELKKIAWFSWLCSGS